MTHNKGDNPSHTREITHGILEEKYTTGCGVRMQRVHVAHVTYYTIILVLSQMHNVTYG